MSCGCSSPSSTPPGSSSSGAASPRSSVGASVVTRQKACAPSPYPTPPTSSQTGREAYSPDWVSTLLGGLTGKLLMLVEDSIQYFRARKSGWLFYNAQSEAVTVENPPFLSSEPTEVEYGFVAKVVSEIRRTCDPETDAVTDTVVQKLASQAMSDRDEGQLVIANSPECGQLSGDQSADSGKQVRFDFLAPVRHETCEKGVGFLVRVPVTVGSGRNQRVVSKWRLLEQMRVRASQFGLVEPNTTESTASLAVIASPVAGGTTDDPCYQLKFLKSQSKGLPQNPAAGDTIYWDGENWKAIKMGLSFRPLTSVTRLITTTSVSPITVTMPSPPAGAPGRVFARLRMTIWGASGGGAMSFQIRHRDLLIGSVHTNASGYSNDGNTVEATIEVIGSSETFTFAKVGTGNISFIADVLGYEY